MTRRALVLSMAIAGLATVSAREAPFLCTAYNGGMAAWCEPRGAEWKGDDDNADFNAARMRWKRTDGQGSYGIKALDGSRGQKTLDKALESVGVARASVTTAKGWSCGEARTDGGARMTAICGALKDDVIIIVTLAATPGVYKDMGGLAAIQANALRTYGFQPATE